MTQLKVPMKGMNLFERFGSIEASILSSQHTISHLVNLDALEIIREKIGILHACAWNWYVISMEKDKENMVFMEKQIHQVINEIMEIGYQLSNAKIPDEKED